MRSASGTLAPDVARALGADGQDRVAAGGEDAAHLVDRRAVPGAVVVGVLEQPVALASSVNSSSVEEVVVDAVDLAVALRAASWRSRSARPGAAPARQLRDDRALPDARRAARPRRASGSGTSCACPGRSSTPPDLGADAGRQPAGRRCTPAAAEARGQVGRQLAPGAQPRAVARALEPEPRGMEELAAQPARALSAAVAQVAGDRQAQERQVRPDLVRPAGQRMQREQRVAAAGAERPRTRSPSRARRQRPPCAADRADRGRSAPRPGRGSPGGSPRTSARYSFSIVRSPNWRMRLAWAASVLATTMQPARLLVEPMHDARPPDAGDRAERLAAIARAAEERVDERPAAVAGRGVDDQPGRLVDDEHRLVLVRDAQRDRLRHERLVRRRAELDRDPLAARQPVARPPPRPVDDGAPVADEPLRVRAADAGHRRDRRGRRGPPARRPRPFDPRRGRHARRARPSFGASTKVR